MSISLVLIPFAIALTVTISELALDEMKKSASAKNQATQTTIPPMETYFTDCSLLVKTLREHGLEVNAISDNHVQVAGGGYELRYERATANDVFYVSASGWASLDQLLADITCFNDEYNRNVQSYTYDRLISNLSESNMTIESETVLEDNSILLTINV